MTKILVAEDDDLMRITVKDRLEKDNWVIDAVHNGREAVDYLKKQQYQLVISDIRMPLFDGWGLRGFVREHSPDTAMLMMTSYGTDDTIETLKREAVDYILKPFDLDELVSKIHKILDQKAKEGG